MIKYLTWTEKILFRTKDVEVCEIIALYFRILRFEVRISNKYFPRKFYNFWKIQGGGHDN